MTRKLIAAEMIINDPKASTIELMAMVALAKKIRKAQRKLWGKKPLR